MVAIQASKIANGNTNVNAYVGTIFAKVFIGNKSLLEGVWKVSAILQYLAAWSVAKHLPWID